MTRIFKSFGISLIIHITLFLAIYLTFETKTNSYHVKKTKVISLSHIILKKPIEQKEVVTKSKQKEKSKKKKSKKKTTKKKVKKQIIKKVSNHAPDIKIDYLTINRSKIYEAIQRAKRYPRIAKKLHIQGVVQVSFTLKSDGSITNIKTTGAKSILLNSARNTIIEASTYFPKPSQNITISVPISYKLR